MLPARTAPISSPRSWSEDSNCGSGDSPGQSVGTTRGGTWSTVSCSAPFRI
ncbi:unnamed protein product [Linum tenue]|uniref:Uncharacterized protein n=1 Tax=Linum tenue TaxID=586396 RepID=A0AAV0MFF9_9ROSI|nr:unnamed protein product [Linum tenue]